MQNVVSVPVHLLFTVKPYFTHPGHQGLVWAEAARGILTGHNFICTVYTHGTALILCTCDAACEPDGLT